ncbi:restriction endonuclease subunit S [Streptomyces sp. KAI-26]|uniref:restriction endonuclease subunit S n=1 Tax=Streptomyces sp. KAI-26 TaxID=1169747 RepID=UPI001C31CF5E|nr:restriction endonuclease subunit S [Streptomyces sp. KAI-26]
MSETPLAADKRNLHSIPKNWSWALLGEIAEVVGGVTKDKKKQSDPTLPEVPYLRVANVQRGRIDLSNVATIRVPESKARQLALRPGDVLLNEGGDRDKLGRGWIWEGQIPGAIHQNHVFRARIYNNIIHPKLLSWYANNAVRWFEANGTQSVNLASISLSKIKQLPVPVPPRAEQHRILEALEGHLSRLDAAERDLNTALLRSGSLKKSALERAMNGGLDAQSDEDEPVSVLLAQVEAELSQVAKGRRRKAPGPAELSPHASPPSHWVVQPIGSLARKIEYGTSAKAHTVPTGADVPVLRMGNIQDGRMDLQNLKYLPADNPDTSKLALSDGDLLFNRTNSAELVGKAAVYRSMMGPATFASYLIRCQLAQGIEPEWVSLCINSPEGRRYINSVAAQQVGQANVNGTKLAAFPIPVPPHGEQLRLLAELHEWRETVERTATIAQRALKRSAHLRRSLLNHAFSGQLVCQDPADEPASVALGRIRTEREAQGDKPKRAVRRPRKTATADAPPAPSAFTTPSPTNVVQQELPL